MPSVEACSRRLCSRRPCSPRPAGRGCAASWSATRPPGGWSTGSSPGRRSPDALAAVRALPTDGIAVTLDHLGRGRHLPGARPCARRDAYLAALEALAPLRPRARRAEVSVKLSAFGQALPDGARPRAGAGAAGGRGGDGDRHHGHPRHGGLPHGRLDARGPRPSCASDHPGTGAVLQAMLHRTEDDAKALAVAGSRVRLVKGAYDEPAVGGATRAEARRRRRLRCAAWRSSWPAPATRWSARTTRRSIARAAAARRPALAGAADSWEVQMLYGIRPDEQRRLAAARPAGARLRALRRRLVRLLHAPAGRAPRQPALLPALARHQVLITESRDRGFSPWTPSPRFPLPRNEPVLSYAPGSPERAALERGSAELADAPFELTATIGGGSGWPAAGRSSTWSQPHRHAAVLGRSAHATPADAEEAVRARQGRPRRGGRSCRSTTGPRCSSRPPTCSPGRGGRPSTRRRCSASRKTAYQAEIDAACELIDFWRFNVHFARQVLAEQPVVLARGVEPGRPPAARGVRLRDHAVQLHRDRRQPAHRAGADGQHGRLEAGADPAVRRALH